MNCAEAPGAGCWAGGAPVGGQEPETVTAKD